MRIKGKHPNINCNQSRCLNSIFFMPLKPGIMQYALKMMFYFGTKFLGLGWSWVGIRVGGVEDKFGRCIRNGCKPPKYYPLSLTPWGFHLETQIWTPSLWKCRASGARPEKNQKITTLWQFNLTVLAKILDFFCVNIIRIGENEYKFVLGNDTFLVVIFYYPTQM